MWLSSSFSAATAGGSALRNRAGQLLRMLHDRHAPITLNSFPALVVPTAYPLVRILRERQPGLGVLSGSRR